MGPWGTNRNYTYSKITHINSQEGKSWWHEDIYSRTQCTCIKCVHIKKCYIFSEFVKSTKGSTWLKIQVIEVKDSWSKPDFKKGALVAEWLWLLENITVSKNVNTVLAFSEGFESLVQFYFISLYHHFQQFFSYNVTCNYKGTFSHQSEAVLLSFDKNI
jgi:hypothetical protein